MHVLGGVWMMVLMVFLYCCCSLYLGRRLVSLQIEIPRRRRRRLQTDQMLRRPWWEQRDVRVGASRGKGSAGGQGGILSPKH